jgi:hypothetical protein
MPVSVNLNKALDKKYEDQPLSQVLDAPVSALAGVSRSDVDLLKQALNIGTVRELGRNRYVRAAVALADLESLAG